MDSHNVGRNRKSIGDALNLITANTLVIGIENDVLFPLSEQKYLADHIPGAEFCALHSDYGHDGFLIETDALTNVIGNFMKESRNKKIIKLQHTA
jgi:homoserine O-acetyltransferase